MTLPPPPPMPVNPARIEPGWEGILNPGERVLWQGRPDGAMRADLSDLRRTAFGAVFAGFGLFWTVAVIRQGVPNGLMALVMPLAGLAFAAVGVNLATGGVPFGVLRRRATTYTLTDRRAIVATAWLGRRTLKSYPLGPDSHATLDDGPRPAIRFATGYAQTEDGSVRTRHGFTHLGDDARQVYDLIRRIQRGQA
ncbi:MAG: hypothetical protein MUF73_04915 [Rhodobacteraceae bacterium]|nr:hypothetical protein [Paracoccaceae bacterium]